MFWNISNRQISNIFASKSARYETSKYQFYYLQEQISAYIAFVGIAVQRQAPHALKFRFQCHSP